MAQEKYLGETGLRRLSELIKEDLSGKANLDGSYDSLQAGSAKQLVSPTGVTDTAPYIFRTTAGSANVSDGIAELKSIRGRTIVWNQNALPLTSDRWGTINDYGTLTNATATSVLYTRNQTDYAGNVPLIFQLKKGGYTSIAGHKYLIKCTITPSASFKFRASIGTYGNAYNPVANVKNYFIEIITASSNDYLQFISEHDGHLPLGGTVLFENVQLFDLTQIYGAGNEPTSVSQFIRDYPNTFYGYDAGTIKNVLTNGLKTVWYNALNLDRVEGELERGIIDIRNLSEGEYYVGISSNNNYAKDSIESYSFSDNSITIKSKYTGFGIGYPVRVVPGTEYTFEAKTTNQNLAKRLAWYDNQGRYISGENTASENVFESPNNAYWCMVIITPFDSTDADTLSDIAFHLTHSGSRTGFEPYEEHVLHIDTAQYFPEGMNGVGTAYDELTPKRAIKRIGMVDMGTMAWGEMSNGRMFTDSIAGVIKQNKNYDWYPNLVCAKYSTDKPSKMASSSPTDKTISVGGNGVTVIVCDSDYTDPTAFKEAMSGVYLYYELKEPEITEIPQTKDINWAMPTSDYGTEEHLLAIGHEVPVPHETLYMDNLVDKLRNLPEPSEYQELSEEVHKPKLLSDIVDADGNPRFQYVPLQLGTWFTEANVQNGFAFYTINGHSFRIVAGGVIPTGTTMPTLGKNLIKEFQIPEWLAKKIFFIDGSEWGSSKDIVPRIIPKATRRLSQAESSTEQINIGNYLGLSGRYRSEDKAYLISSPIGGISLTTKFDCYFRFEWNLIIN